MSILATIDALHAELDAHPDAHYTRLILADALEDAGGEFAAMAEGYRALGIRRVKPMKRDYRDGVFYHYHARGKICAGEIDMADAPECHELTRDWIARFPAHVVAWSEGDILTRREAEDAAALAFSKLPAARRAELLAAAPEVVK